CVEIKAHTLSPGVTPHPPVSPPPPQPQPILQGIRLAMNLVACRCCLFVNAMNRTRAPVTARLLCALSCSLSSELLLCVCVCVCVCVWLCVCVCVRVMVWLVVVFVCVWLCVCVSVLYSAADSVSVFHED